MVNRLAITTPVVGMQRSGGFLQRCLKANFSSDTDDHGELTDIEPETEDSLVNEFGLCHVTLLGRVGVKPRLVETPKTSFVTFIVGVNSQIVGKTKQSTKWHEIHVNATNSKESVLKNIEIGDRVYVTGNLSYVQDDQYVKKYRIYSNYVRLISHSKKYWEKAAEQDMAEEDSVNR